MTRIRINTGQVNDAGRRMASEAAFIADTGRRLTQLIDGLDWEGRQRLEMEHKFAAVRPRAEALSRQADDLARRLMRIAAAFEKADNEAAQELSGLPWMDFLRAGEMGAGAGEMADLGGAISAAAGFLAPGFGVLATEWLPERTELGRDLGFLGREHKLWPERRGRPPNNHPSQRLTIAAWEDQAWEGERTGHTRLGGVRLGGKTEAEALQGELGLGVNWDKGKTLAGVYAAGTLFTVGASGVLGSTDGGLASGIEVTAGEIEALVGLKNGRAAAKIGGTLVSVEGTVGANVAGWNVGLTGEVGVKFEIGLEVGKKTKVYLGPFTIGLNIGEALGS